jgi:hypothetical protein
LNKQLNDEGVRSGMTNNVFTVYFQGHIEYQVAQPQTFFDAIRREGIQVDETFPLEQLGPEAQAQKIQHLLKLHTDRVNAGTDWRKPYVIEGVNVGSPEVTSSLQPPSGPA